MKRNLIRLAILGILAALGALALYLTGVGAQAARTIAVLGQLRPDTIGMALGLSVLSALFSGVVWWRLLQRLGYRMRFRVALAAYLNAGLAGYVVNIAGPALGSALSLRRHGVSPGRAVLLTLLANALGFCGILAWAPVGLLLLSRSGMDSTLPILGGHGVAAVVVIVAVLVVAMFVVIRALASVAGSRNRLARLLLGRAHTTEDGVPSTLRPRQVFALVPFSALSWPVGTGALYVVLVAMSHGAAVDPVAVIGASVLAAALGSLAFFAPEGVGVKDGALVVLLTHATGLPITTGVAAALAVRALDPVTKLSMLGVLALRVDVVMAWLLRGVATWPRHGRLYARLQAGLVARGSRRLVLLGAGLLTAVLLLSGYSGIAHADWDVASNGPHTRSPSVVVASQNRMLTIDVYVGGTPRTSTRLRQAVLKANTAGSRDIDAAHPTASLIEGDALGGRCFAHKSGRVA